MSFSSLSSKLYTIKSRKNTSTSDAFISMIREDMAMRFSVYSMAKSLTGSDFFASVLESKYGKSTPLERQEEQNRKKSSEKEKKFKQYTVESLVRLNNKINTLVSLTERNTALILNLYNDLGTFRNQRKFTPATMRSMNAVRMPIKSRTVKYQIDDIRAQLAALQQITLGSKISRKMKSASENGIDPYSILAGAGLGAAAAGLGSKGGPSTRGGSRGSESGSSETDGMSLLDKILLGLAAKDAARAARSGYRYVRKKYFPTPKAGTATPVSRVTPRATFDIVANKANTPQWNSKAQQFVDPKTKQFISRDKAIKIIQEQIKSGNIGQDRGPGTTAGAVSRQNAPSEKLSNLMRRLPPGLTRILGGIGRVTSTPAQVIGLIGAGTWDILSGKTAGDMSKAADEVAKTFGMKLIKGSGGATVGYSIDGKIYKYEELPQEYKDIIDAFISPDRVAKNIALKKIAANPKQYELLKNYQSRSNLITASAPESTAATEAAVAAKAAELIISEPSISTSTQVDVAAPTTIKQPTKSANDTVLTIPKTGNYMSDFNKSAGIATSPADIPIDFAAFAKQIAMLESGGGEAGYSVVNKLGYLGRYQFGALALQDMGLVKKGTSLKGLDDPKNWNINGGKQAFLNNHKLQEETFAKYTTMNYSRLKNLGVVTTKSPPGEIAGYLAASHLVGPGGARDLASGVVKADAFGTKSSKYFVAGALTQHLMVASAKSSMFPATGSSASSVKTPPTSPSMQPTSDSSDDLANAQAQSQAALMSIDAIQKSVTMMAKKVLDLERQINTSDTFPAVRNQSLG